MLSEDKKKARNENRVEIFLDFSDFFCKSDGKVGVFLALYNL